MYRDAATARTIAWSRNKTKKECPDFILFLLPIFDLLMTPIGQTQPEASSKRAQETPFIHIGQTLGAIK